MCAAPLHIDDENYQPVLKGKKREERYFVFSFRTYFPRYFPTIFCNNVYFYSTCIILSLFDIIFILYREDGSSRYQRALRSDEIDRKFGYERYIEPEEKMGWLINFHPVSQRYLMN